MKIPFAGERVPWLLSRLLMMSPLEIAQRSRTHMRLALWRRRRVWPAPRHVVAPARGTYRVPTGLREQDVRDVLLQADGLLEGRVVLLDQEFTIRDVNWSLDPQTGRSAPLDFGPTLDYRNGSVAGNARNVWELNRHQYLTHAALAYAISGDERYAKSVRRQLESWLEQNPFPLGLNWSSPLEFGLRLISWVWISRFLSESPEWDVLFGPAGRMWPAVYRQQWMIAELHSVGSSANNHLIGEMAGLFVSTLEWPWFADSSAWRRLAQRVLEAEIAKQYYPSGINREQAFGYHVFTTELLIQAGVEGERASQPFSRGYLGKIRRAVRAALAQVGPGGLLPAYGDYDEGVAVGFPGGAPHALERIAAVVSDWTGEPVDMPLASAARLAALVQLSGLELTRRESTSSPGAGEHAGSQAFFDAGLFLMRSRAGNEDVLVMADAGDLGYLSIAAHGHADSLSFTLSVGGEPLLIDPGTYAYHSDPEARAYFRGTLAHNTVCVDGADQSQAGGPFLWTRKARTVVHEWRAAGDGALLTASHDGYMRLSPPVRHRRTLALQGQQLCVDDELAGEGEHHIEWRLHVAPGCIVRLDESECEVKGRRHSLSIRLDESLRWECMVGEARGGWCSSAFNRREETTTIVGTATLPMPARLRHRVRVK